MPEATFNRAYLALGSNIEPETNLPRAVGLLSEYGRIVSVSRVWETVPVGFADQANFLNGAVLLDLSHGALPVEGQVVAVRMQLHVKTAFDHGGD